MIGLRSESVTSVETVQSEPVAADDHREQPVTSYSSDTDLTLSACEYTPGGEFYC